MKKYLLIFAAVFSLEYAVFAQSATKVIAVVNFSAERFKAIIANDKNGIILDLRTTDEIAKGYIKGSVPMIFGEKGVEQEIDKLEKNKTYYIYDTDGKKSSEVAEYMDKHNFKHIFTLEKGFSDWEKKGYPVEKK